MLNINAKCFVPPGANSAQVPTWRDTGFYQYHVNVPLRKVADLSTNAKGKSHVSSLLSSKKLFAVRGSLDEEVLQYFLTTNFMLATNIPERDDESGNSSGFLLSRYILSLSADANIIIALNNARGYLIRLDIPADYGFNASVLISCMWDSFFGKIRNDTRFTAMGYVRSLVGLNQSASSGTYRHYFFLACSSPDTVLNLYDVSSQDFTSQPLSVLPVSSIVSFLCSSQTPLCLMITVGEEARKKYLEDAKCDFSLEIDYFIGDLTRTYENLKNFEKIYVSILDKNCRWERTYVAHLHVNAIVTQSEDVFPFCDLLRFIANVCDNSATTFMGVSFSDPDIVPANYELVVSNKQAPFFRNASFAEVIGQKFSFDTINTIYSSIPQKIWKPLKPSTFAQAVNAIHTFRLKSLSKLLKEELLTSLNFSDAADHFAKHFFLVRRKLLGVPILLGIDNDGIIYAVDLKKISVFGLPNILPNVSRSLRNCLFKATLTSSYHAFDEYRIIIEDVFIFNGDEVHDRRFTDRWQLLEYTDLLDEGAVPHATHIHIVALKAVYFFPDKTEALLQAYSSNYASEGIIFVPDDFYTSGQMNSFVYLWKLPSSSTAFFNTSNLETLPDTKNKIKRALLSVRIEGVEKTFTSYKGEYVDFLAKVHPEIKKGSVIECILRRSSEVGHWWDLLRSYDRGLHNVSTYEEVTALVHNPGIVQSEMDWLLNAKAYQCERCRKVDDIGEVNPRQNAYWCRNCSTETGHGDCVYCGNTFTLGMLDGVSNFFYCESCWNTFSCTNTSSRIEYHVPPPPNATFKVQVMTRCVSLLIDQVIPKCPTNDVLDLCCGGSVVRKWMINKTMRYVGVDLEQSVVDSVRKTIRNSPDFPRNALYNVIRADALCENFWINTISKVHPQQFQTITCFSAFHIFFFNEMKARQFIADVANALVPGGLFLGFVLDASAFFSKGTAYKNSIFRTEWEDGSVPRIGQRFNISTEGGPLKEVAVVPMDFLVAVASEHALKLIIEVCQTVQELIDKDTSWTRVPSTDEKEYLCAVRSFAFKKESRKQLPFPDKA